MKLRRNEQSKDIKGYEGIYAITSLGRVWSHRRKIWLRQGNYSAGYPNVTLSISGKERTYRVHQLVAKAFIPNPDNKPQINHKNGDKKDCKASNLEWVTARENIQHSIDLGLSKTGKLSYPEKELICHLHSDQKVKQNKIAEMFNVTPPAIHYVLKTYTPVVQTNHFL
jgi:hypothetical protein